MAFKFSDIVEARAKSGSGSIQKQSFSDSGINARSVDFFISPINQEKVLEAIGKGKTHSGRSAFMKFSSKRKDEFQSKEEFFSESIRIYCSKKLVVQLVKQLASAEKIEGSDLVAIPCSPEMMSTLFLYKCTPGDTTFYIIGTEADDGTLAVRDFIDLT